MKQRQTVTQTVTQTGLDKVSQSRGGGWFSMAADHKNSHHIAYPHLHRCLVSAIPVLGIVGN